MNLVIKKMERENIDDILVIEQLSYGSHHWSYDSFLTELNKFKRYDTDLRTVKDYINANGGIASFRYSIENVGNYVSNEAGEVVYNGLLLNKTGIKIEQVQSKLMFEMVIKTNKNITYRSSRFVIDTPAGDLTKEGKSSIEITDFGDVIFKRVKE